MAKFLGTTGINYYLEELIKEAREELVLVSPFLKLNDRVKSLLLEKGAQDVQVSIIYGKKELEVSELTWLESHGDFINLFFCENLHAKCYLNEANLIVSSLNLYEFSQVNNNEAGILLNYKDDSQAYKDAHSEVRRFLKMSIPREKKEKGRASVGMTPSFRAALRLGLSSKILIDVLFEKGLIEGIKGDPVVTTKGKSLGIERKKGKFDWYFMLPKDFSLLKDYK